MAIQQIIETARKDTDGFSAANNAILSQVEAVRKLLEKKDVKGALALLDEIEAHSEDIVTAVVENTPQANV